MDSLVTPARTPSYPEIWLAIFSDLPNCDLKAITLTCRYFTQLAQTFLYQHISFDLSADGPIKPSTSTDSSRINFLTSEKIAHSVHMCNIFSSVLTSDDLPLAATTLSSYLPNFIHLTDVHLTRLRLSNRIMNQLSLVKSLRFIRIDACIWVPQNDHTSRTTLGIVKVALNQIQQSRSFPLLLRWLDSEVLRHMILCDTGSLQAIVGGFSNMPIFSSLRLLELCIAFISWPAMIAVLSASHSLERLTIRVDRSRISMIDRLRSERPSYPETVIVPRLESYTGPPDLLPLISGGGQLRELRLAGTMLSNVCRPEEIIASLVPSVLGCITSLLISTTYLKEEHMEDIVALAPQVKNLTIAVATFGGNGSFISTSADTFFASLPHAFPKDIENLDIFWIKMPELPISPLLLASFTSVVENFIQNYPVLRSIKIRGQLLTFFWEKQIKGPDIILTRNDPYYMTDLL